MSKPVATNRKGYRDFHILESVECGIELKGSEVKSLRDGKINLDESYARVEKGGLMLFSAHISPYAQASYLNVEPTRPRRLLLHKAQIEKLITQTSQKGLTLVPLKVYFNSRGFAKVELALCRGKKMHDRREDIKRKDIDRQMRRVVKDRKSR